MFSQKWRTMTDHERLAAVSRLVDAHLSKHGGKLSATQRLWGLGEATKTVPKAGYVTSFPTAVGSHAHVRSGYLVHARARGNSRSIPDLTVFVPFKLRVKAPVSSGGKPVFHANTEQGYNSARYISAELKREHGLLSYPKIKSWDKKRNN